MAKATDTKTVSTRGKQLQATVTNEVHDAYEEYHWEARKNTVDLVREAIIEFGVKRGFLTIGEDGEAVPTPKA